MRAKTSLTENFEQFNERTSPEERKRLCSHTKINRQIRKRTMATGWTRLKEYLDEPSIFEYCSPWYRALQDSSEESLLALLFFYESHPDSEISLNEI
jgi:hypothetical protein